MLINLKKDTKYEIGIYPQADKFLYKLSKKDTKTLGIVLKAIRELNIDPNNSIKLINTKNKRRIKAGDYRVIFEIDNNTSPKEINILKIGHRRNVYKNLNEL